jgi:hypothetical protein
MAFLSAILSAVQNDGTYMSQAISEIWNYWALPVMTGVSDIA